MPYRVTDIIKCRTPEIFNVSQTFKDVSFYRGEGGSPAPKSNVSFCFRHWTLCAVPNKKKLCRVFILVTWPLFISADTENRWIEILYNFVWQAMCLLYWCPTLLIIFQERRITKDCPTTRDEQKNNSVTNKSKSVWAKVQRGCGECPACQIAEDCGSCVSCLVSVSVRACICLSTKLLQWWLNLFMTPFKCHVVW